MSHFLEIFSKWEEETHDTHLKLMVDSHEGYFLILLFHCYLNLFTVLTCMVHIKTKKMITSVLHKIIKTCIIICSVACDYFKL